MSIFGTTLRSGHIAQEPSSLSCKDIEEQINKQEIIISNLEIKLIRSDNIIQLLQDKNVEFQKKKEKYISDYCSLLKQNFSKYYFDCKEITKQKKSLRPSEYKSKFKEIKQFYKLLSKSENKKFKQMMPKENPKEIRKRNFELMHEISYRSGIHDEIRIATEAIQLYCFIRTTQTSIKDKK